MGGSAIFPPVEPQTVQVVEFTAHSYALPGRQKGTFAQAFRRCKHVEIVSLYQQCDPLLFKCSHKAEVAHRELWNYYHHNLGRVAVLAAFANAILGLHIGDLDWGWYLGLCLIWVLIWVLGGAKAFYDRRRIRHGEFLKVSANRSGASETGTQLTGQSQNGRFTLL